MHTANRVTSAMGHMMGPPFANQINSDIGEKRVGLGKNQ